MSIQLIQSFYKKQIELEQKIRKAQVKYANFLDQSLRASFLRYDDDFDRAYKAEYENTDIAKSNGSYGIEEYEILEIMALERFSSELDSLENRKIMTRDERLKIEFPNKALDVIDPVNN